MSATIDPARDPDLAAAAAGATAALARLEDWLTRSALPLWWRVGTDHVGGGFFEKIDLDGRAIEATRRTRVTGRQLYVFATAARFGWSADAAAAISHGLSWFRRACLAADGTVVSTSHPDGRPADPRFELYDHAFALFGLAAVQAVAPSDELVATARRMRERMKAGWGHPIAGFEAANPRRLPLEANPHMHVFEAALAWEAVAPGAERAAWAGLADEIAGLCLDRFVHPESGAVREFFDGDWRPAAGEAGRIVEPGHQFEWAWLLARWGSARGEARAIAAARRLVEIAEGHGVDPVRGVAFAELWDDFSPKDRVARVWPQTERIKAWLAMAGLAATEAERAAALDKVVAATTGLDKYFSVSIPGLWRERLAGDGAFLVEPVPASSLYHITCAVTELRLRLTEFAVVTR